MPAATSALEDSSLPSVATADLQQGRRKANPERRRELEDILSHSLPFFRKVALRQLGNHEDAEDAVQDAMLLAFRHIGQFGGRARMTTWLTSIVINTARMQLRRRPRFQLLSLDQTTEKHKWTISEMIADAAPTPDKVVERSELRKLVAKLTSTLSSGQQEALLLIQQDGLTGKQVAETLGIPEGTAKARLARGRIHLTQRFHAITATPKTRTSNAGSKAKRNTSSSGHKADCAQVIAPMPVRVFRQQGGCKAAIGA
jgi:RNA polymerase sigma-70 factor, ECF subfamily